MNDVAFLVPGDLETRTGGYGYDRKIIAGLRARGWSVAVRGLDASFPFPTSDASAHAARTLREMPDGSVVVIDGLAYGAMPDEAAQEAARLRLVALVHHPLADETGLLPEAAEALRASEARALAAARLVIVTSRATASGVARYGVPDDRIVVVEPGTDPAPLARGSGGATIELICVGTLTPRKGHLTLIHALAEIRHLPWHLTCAGALDRDPETTARVRTSLAESGLASRVCLAGDLDADRLGACYDRADLFVLPTELEGYGMAVAEALARGLPVVSTPTGAIPDLVSDAGVLVPSGDARALADALARVIGDARHRTRLRDAAARVRTALPTWESAAAAMAAALDRVARG